MTHMTDVEADAVAEAAAARYRFITEADAQIYVLQLDGAGKAPPMGFWLVGPFADGEEASKWANSNERGDVSNWQVVSGDPRQPLIVTSPEEASWRR